VVAPRGFGSPRECGAHGKVGLTDGLVEQKGFADVFDLGDRAFEVEGLGEDDFEDLRNSCGISREFGWIE
jgi:hypothetical protein